MKQINGMWLPNGDTFFQNRGDYESYDYSRLKPHLKKHRVAIDIGAHVGYWSRRLVKDFESVYAFEAEPEHVECLRANVSDKNILITEIALSNKQGTVKFNKTIDNSGMSHVSDTGVDVECAALDTWKLNNVDLIKLDVEGHELAVLQGAKQTILHSRPVIFMEILNSMLFDKRKAIMDLLAEWNYMRVERVEENYIFVSVV